MSIKVTGNGSIQAKPDYVTMDVHIKTLTKDYQRSVSENQIKSNELKKALIKLGFKENDLKSGSFNIYQDIQDDKSIMYRMNHSLTFSFDFTLDMLNKTIEAIVNSKTGALFNVSFGLKDESKVQKKLFEKARNDAFEKATTLVSLENRKLGEIVSIDAREFHPNFFSHTQMSHVLAIRHIDSFTPQDITLDIEVLYEWNIV